MAAITASPDAQFTLYALAEGIIDVLVIPHTLANVAPSYQEIEILPGAEHALDITLQAGSAINGEITDAQGDAIQGAELFAITTIPGLASSARQNSEGHSQMTPDTTDSAWSYTDGSLTVTFEPRTGELARQLRLTDARRFSLGGFQPSSAHFLIRQGSAKLADQWVEPGTDVILNIRQ